MAHEFPGNVRELENIIERAVIFCHDDAITRENLFLEDETASSAAVDDTAQGLLSLPFKGGPRARPPGLPRRYVDRLLREHEGNISRAADAAGIQRQYFYKLMKHAGIDQGRVPPGRRAGEDRGMTGYPLRGQSQTAAAAANPTHRNTMTRAATRRPGGAGRSASSAAFWRHSAITACGISQMQSASPAGTRSRSSSSPGPG